MEAEAVRDIALAASGLLNPKVGGPPRLSAGAGVPVRPAGQLRAQGLERRARAPTAIAGRSTRSASARSRIPVLQTFDAPNGEFACVRRTRSNTPLQALATLNEPLFLECARALALKTLQRRRHDRRGPPRVMPSAAARPRAR